MVGVRGVCMVGSDAVKGEGWKRRPGHGDLIVADAAVLSLSFLSFPNAE